MTPILWMLSGGIFLSAALTIAAQYRHAKRLEYVAKPLTTALIVALALGHGRGVPSLYAYQTWIVLGLLASLVGDVCLMLEGERWFVRGLTAFLVAHLFYIAAFTVARDGETVPWYYALPFLAYGALMLRILWPHLGELRPAVSAYLAVIMVMAWQAATRWIAVQGAGGSSWALAGAYLFVLSDSVLAVARFRGEWRSARFWVLSTYFAAQWLLAFSVG